MTEPALSPRAFKRIVGLFERETGIRLSAQKHSLVMSRLTPRMRTLRLPDLDAYCDIIEQPMQAEERQLLVDRLTTNETYFFREPEHFAVLRSMLSAERTDGIVELWSAACSSGEEAYSLAMLLSELRPNGQFVVRGSDISARVLQRAVRAVYPTARLEQLPAGYLQRYFLRGHGAYRGTVRIAGGLRERVEFFHHNLMQTDAALGLFDVVFLRNALIYFSGANKQLILERVSERLRPGGLLFIGLSESLHGHSLPLTAVGRSVYRRVTAKVRSQ
jgi:chemotaxis protein methyltransferase CheR